MMMMKKMTFPSDVVDWKSTTFMISEVYLRWILIAVGFFALLFFAECVRRMARQYRCLRRWRSGLERGDTAQTRAHGRVRVWTNHHDDMITYQPLNGHPCTYIKRPAHHLYPDCNG